MKMRVVVTLIFLFVVVKVDAVIKGAANAVSIEQAVTFPSADADNTLAAFGWFKNGFSLEDSLTTCTFQSVFPVGGSVALNGGTLYLDNDLSFSNGVVFIGDGSVHMGVHNIDFGRTNVTWSGDISWTMNKSSFSFYSCINLDGVWTCNGTGEIKGHGHTLSLGNGGAIVVGRGSTLTLHDLTLEAIAGTNICCTADDSLLILDQVRWGQQEDSSYTFTEGALQIRNQVKMSGASSSFVYQTVQTSTVGADASLQLEPGFTFSYDPLSGGNNLLMFGSSSSELTLNNATLHTTSTGLQLTQGCLTVKGDSTMCSEIWEWEDEDERIVSKDAGITLGDGILSGNDLKTTIRLGAQLKIPNGSLIYNNLLATSWVMENQVSSLVLQSGARLCINQSLDLGVGQMVMSEKSLHEIAIGKEIIGAVFIED